MNRDFDRDPLKEPSLEEMTEKAIELLSKNTNGFFLMVEGSQIDWASHENDPLGIVTEILAFDRAVKVSLDFAKKNNNTIVIVAPDHGNSGLTIGNRDLSSYSSEPFERFINPFLSAKFSTEKVSREISSNRSNIKEVLKNFWGLTNLTEKENLFLQETKNLKEGLSVLFSKRAGLGFTSNGHTGEDVLLGIYDPRNKRLEGVVENTDIFYFICEALGINYSFYRNLLFQDVRDIFKDAEISEISSTSNTVLKVKTKKETFYFYQNQSIAKKENREFRLLTPTVKIKDRWFISQ